MKLLLDTHTFLWLLNSPEKLSEQALAACKSLQNQLLFSVVSAWEIQIKGQLGKLVLDAPLPAMLQAQQEANGLQILPVTLEHVFELDRLARHHQDPFDRLLVAQARVEACRLVTADSVIPDYSVDVVW